MKPYLRIVMIIAAIVAVYLLWGVISDYLVQILTLGGLGAAAVGAKRMAAVEAEKEADAHENMQDIHVIEAAKEINQARESAAEAAKIAENSKPADIPLPDGFKRVKKQSR